MKEQDKQMLLKDLCGRLPYMVKGMLCEDCICTLDKIWTKKGYELVVFAGDYYDVDCFKPYLFPLSSMTEEQREEYDALKQDIEDKFKPWKCANLIDWLNKHHFDYNELIGMKLALDATDLNIY